MSSSISSLSSSSSPAVSTSFQRGFAKLIAEQVNNHTRLTHVSHQSPTRLLPLTGSSLLEKSRKAQCALSNYGGGMVHGDESIVTLHVKEGASLGLTTQGPNRIYKAKPTTCTTTGSTSASTTTDPHTTTGRTSITGMHSVSAGTATCKTMITATIEDHGFLVLAPDPTVLFKNSNYEQVNEFFLAGKDSSCIAVDWFSAGRIQNGEEWNLNTFSTTTKLFYSPEHDPDPNNNYSDDCKKPILVDRIRLATKSNSSSLSESPQDGYHTNFWGTQALCSILLAGPKSIPVVHQLQAWSSQLTSRITPVRNAKNASHDHSNNDCCVTIPIGSLGENVIVSVSQVHQQYRTATLSPSPLYVARIAAQSNEDIYRVLYDSLLTLDFGVPFYKDRVSSSRTCTTPKSGQPLTTTTTSDAPTTHGTSTNTSHTKMTDSTTLSGTHAKDDVSFSPLSKSCMNGIKRTNSVDAVLMTDQNLWSAFIMMDSFLPTGSFAHSSGMEVAQQFGFLQDEDHVHAYIVAATHSALQLATPYMITSLHQAQSIQDASKLLMAWKELDQRCHCLMVSNGPACQASMDQGHGLLRVALTWARSKQQQSSSVSNDNPHDDAFTKLQLIQSNLVQNHGHLAPLFGMITHLLLGISNSQMARHMLAYSMTRDMISAAVRLNAIGPLASIGILDRLSQQFYMSQSDSMMSLEDASSSTPLLDVLHPCHDLLAVRLFRT